MSRGSVATRLLCGGIIVDHLIANLLPTILVKEFRKYYFSIWCSYDLRNLGDYFVLATLLSVSL